ncbi:MAG: V-type ATP synthase subunit E [Desulfurococcales archaeon]|nr:V-type ATP synthase subunit E [Desulfurococcales archaeon]
MSMKGSVGDLASTIISREMEDYKSKIEEAYKAALKLIEETREKEYRESIRKIQQDIANAEERLRSEESSLELQLRTARSETINKWVELVVEEAINRALKERSSDWYKSFMRGLVERLSEEASSSVFIVRCAKEDHRLVEKLLKETGLYGKTLKLDKEHAGIKGGIIAVSEDGDIVLDYSFELFLENIKPKIRTRIARLLEG